MEAAGTLLLEPVGHLDGIVGVRRLLGRVAAAETDRPAAAEVDAGITIIRAPFRDRPHEVRVDREPRLAGLLRVELRREHVVARRRRPRTAARAPSRPPRPRSRPARTSARSRSAFRPRCPRRRGARGPTRPRSSRCAAPSRRRGGGGDAPGGRRARLGVLLAALEQHLHPDADAEDRCPRLDRAGDRPIQAPAPIARTQWPKWPTPGDHDRVRRAAASGPRSPRAPPDVRERAGHRVEVPAAVVEHGDPGHGAYSVPFVLGTSSDRSGRTRRRAPSRAP